VSRSGTPSSLQNEPWICRVNLTWDSANDECQKCPAVTLRVLSILLMHVLQAIWISLPSHRRTLMNARAGNVALITQYWIWNLEAARQELSHLDYHLVRFFVCFENNLLFMSPWHRVTLVYFWRRSIFRRSDPKINDFFNLFCSHTQWIARSASHPFTNPWPEGEPKTGLLLKVFYPRCDGMWFSTLSVVRLAVKCPLKYCIYPFGGIIVHL